MTTDGLTSSLDDDASTPVDTDNAQSSEWDRVHATGSQACSDIVSTLTNGGLLTPPAPGCCAEGVPVAWGTADEIEPFSLYLDAFDILEQCVSTEFDDFWLHGHRGHGLNSFGMGLLTRVGGMFVAQQHAHGGAYMADNTVRKERMAW
jgi:hypothetical protein